MSESWWRYTIPLDGTGKPEKRFCRHPVKGWWVVRDPLAKNRLTLYCQDEEEHVWSRTPPPIERGIGTQPPPRIERHIGTQTDPSIVVAVASASLDPSLQSGWDLVHDREVQTDIVPDAWDMLRDSVASLSLELQDTTYFRSVRFLDIGLLHLGRHRSQN